VSYHSRTFGLYVWDLLVKRNGAKMMEICYIFDSTIVQHFSFRARLQFLEKQKQVFHSFLVSLFLQRRARAQPSTPVKPPPTTPTPPTPPAGSSVG
jgi:hypothetical protein